ncbi:MAG: hydrolase 2, exosortase A system-associated [Chromatiales bacterium]|nr:hydrolase 2, exosortase A system-associated [Chromatiales bacterium]
MTADDVEITPFFLTREPGPLFCIQFSPTRGSLRGRILYLHPFAEEMHKSRRMAALQARRMATEGYAVLLLDLTGCGDSWGDFGDARWSGWIQDAARALLWLGETHRDAPLLLWGLRLGATLAIDLAAVGVTAVDGVILWQPVTHGERFLNQFLRTKLASEILTEGRARTRIQELRERLKAGESVEVGGYRLAAELAESIVALQLDQMPPPHRVFWIDIVADSRTPLASGCERVMRNWLDQGCQLRSIRVTGEPFWITQEITECPALLEVTLDGVGWLLR